MAEIKKILVSQIKENPDALREVDKTTEKYAGLVDSIRDHGVLNSITVRAAKDDAGNDIFGLIDGLHRWTAAQDAGLTEIPAQVLSASDAEALELQIVANIHKVETKPVEYARQILRLAAQNPTMTTRDLAKKVNMGETWVKDRLSLIKLSEDIQALVDDSKITLLNAYNLAKLKPEDQVNYLDRAMTQGAEEFSGIVAVRVKEVRDADRQGRAAKPEEFVPVARPRKSKELEDELKSHSAASLSSDPASFLEGIKFALCLDNASVTKSREAWEAQKKAKAEEKARKDLEALKKKQAKAAETQAEVAGKLAELGVTAVSA